MNAYPHDENARISGKWLLGIGQQNRRTIHSLRGFGQEKFPLIGSKGGGEAESVACSLIETMKLNGVDPNPVYLSSRPNRR